MMKTTTTNSRIKLLIASGLWAILITLSGFNVYGCATTSTEPPPPVGTVTQAIRHYVRGDFVYFLKIEFDSAPNVHNNVTVPVTQREYQLFGREGARVCLYPFGQRWRLDRCAD